MNITAQDLYNYTKCKHRVYLDAKADPSERGEVSVFVQMLWEMGLQTEAEYLDTLGAQEYENLASLSLDEAAIRTGELMRAGAALIYQGVIRAGDLIGRPDLLIRRDDASSRFGDFYYEAVDIKAGKGREERGGKRTKFKRHYAFQILFYRRILEVLQDYAPPSGRIVNVEKETEEFQAADISESFTSAFAEARALVEGSETSEPVLSSTCHQCPWYARCRRWVEGHQDPTLLFFVGKNKFQLKQAGLNTVQDIAAMDVAAYLKPPKKMPGLGKQTLARMKERARVMLGGKPVIRPGFEFPKGKKEIYFDIEDDPTQDLTYLYGLLVQDASGDWTYKNFLSESPADEKQTVREFWDYIARLSDTVFYVYSPKERSTLRKLMERYGLDPDVYDQYAANEYDLYTDLVVKYSDWPTYSYGIKNIARLVGFSWRDTDPSGANSIVWYNEYLKDQSKVNMLNRIVEYNEDDCRAMLAIKEFFEEQGRGDIQSL